MLKRSVMPLQSSHTAAPDIFAARPRLPVTDALVPYLRRLDENRWFSNFGPLIGEFETRLAARFKSDAKVVTCVNATQALTLTLKALDLATGSLVIVPAYTFVATAHAVLAAGLVPWFLDVDDEDWMLQPETVREALATAPGVVSAVIPVAAYGALPDIEGWKSLREDTGLAVILDGAAAFDQACDAGLPTVISLHATKVLGIGEGGFLVTEDGALAGRVRQLTTFGFVGSRVSEIAATNAKLSEYAGAIGLAALDGWDADRLQFLHTARLMRAAMTFLPQVQFQPGWGVDWITSVCAVRLPDRSVEIVEQTLEHMNIQTRRWWDRGCHTNPAFSDCPRGNLSATDRLGLSVIGLPFAIDMSENDISRLSTGLSIALSRC